MKRITFATLTVLFVASTVFAADFAPTLLKLSAPQVIHYDFDGSRLEIPVTVKGTPANTVFMVYTKGQADVIDPIQNGYLGWHYVNKIDTCVYLKEASSLDIGSNEITWDGKDNDGGAVPAGDYTYYLWAYDNKSDRQKMCNNFFGNTGCSQVQEYDSNGITLANPIMYNIKQRWTVGSDPMDESLLETSFINQPLGWVQRTDITKGWPVTPCIDPNDFNYFYVQVLKGTELKSGICKYQWTPNGKSEFQTNFGEDGFSDLFDTVVNSALWVVGVETDGEYLYTTDIYNFLHETPKSEFYIYDFDGKIVDMIDLTEWWSSSTDLAAGGQMNGGPNTLTERNGKIFLNAHGSCIKQMVDPIRYLESGNETDFFVWTNSNGDYVLDHNFAEDSQRPWVCNDFNTYPYMYNLDADDMMFSKCISFYFENYSFGMLGPDGTGIGYFSFAGDGKNHDTYNNFFIDSGSAYDGLYSDNYHTSGYDVNFIGHDSIKGVITSSVSVDNDDPAAFAVDQNSPNPFNPTTTINYSLDKPGMVNLVIYDLLGRKVATLVDEMKTPGSHAVTWNAEGHASGVYFYRIEFGGSKVLTQKMMLVK